MGSVKLSSGVTPRQAVAAVPSARAAAPASAPASAPSSQPPAQAAGDRLSAQTLARSQALPSVAFIDDERPPLPTPVTLPTLPQHEAPAPQSAPSSSEELQAPQPTPVDLSAPPAPESAKPASAKPESAKPGPGFTEIRGGSSLKPKESSPDLPRLQEMLAKAGYKVAHEGKALDGELLRALTVFQADAGIARKGSPFSGILGRQTLAALEKSQTWGVYDTAQGGKNAAAALERIKPWQTEAGGNCYYEGAKHLDKAYGQRCNWLKPGDAWTASASLKESGLYRKLDIQPKDFANLPDGAVIVYKPHPQHPVGHFEVVATDEQGQKTAISDFRRPLYISPWRGISDDEAWKYAEVFVPKKTH